MFNSLLNAPSSGPAIDSLILNIVIILGVVIAGALIIYFLWEAVTNLTNKEKNKSRELNFDDDKKSKTDNVFVQDYTLDEEKTASDEKNDVVLIDSAKVEDVNEEKAEEEKSEAETEAEEEDETARRRAQLEARRQELIRRMQEEAPEVEEESTGSSC